MAAALEKKKEVRQPPTVFRKEEATSFPVEKTPRTLRQRPEPGLRQRFFYPRAEIRPTLGSNPDLWCVLRPAGLASFGAALEKKSNQNGFDTSKKPILADLAQEHGI